MLKDTFEKFLKKTEISLHVIAENRNLKMLHTGFPKWPRPSLLRRLTTPFTFTEGRISLAAALAQDPSSSSLTASADGGWKTLDILLLSLSRYSVTCHLLVSA